MGWPESFSLVVPSSPPLQCTFLSFLGGLPSISGALSGVRAGLVESCKDMQRITLSTPATQHTVYYLISQLRFKIFFVAENVTIMETIWSLPI